MLIQVAIAAGLLVDLSKLVDTYFSGVEKTAYCIVPSLQVAGNLNLTVGDGRLSVLRLIKSPRLLET